MTPWFDWFVSWRTRVSAWWGRLPALGFRLLFPLVALSALAAIGVYLTLGVIHLCYPFEIEWMEGGMIDAVRRVAAGHRLYVKPSVEFVPHIYAPLYFYVAAAFGKVLGAGFFSARLVSLVASLGAMGLIYRFVGRETGSRFSGLCAVGLFGWTYDLAIGFYDIARVDSLFVFLLLLGLYTLRFHASVASRLTAAALFTLAFLAKQSAVVVFAPLALHALVADGKRGLPFALGGAALMASSVALLDWLHGGWFGYYVFWLPRQYPLTERMWLGFWLNDLMAPLGVSVLVSLFYLVVQKGAPGRWFYLASLAGMLGAAWVGRLHAGGWRNVNMPGLAMIAVLFGLGIHAGLSRAADLPEAIRKNAQAFVLALVLAQFACLTYDPARYVPSSDDRAAGQELLAQIRAVEGDVWMPSHGFLSALAGKRTFAHEMAVQDVIGPGGGRPGAELRANIARAFGEKRFAAVISDGDWFRHEIGRSYRRRGPVFTKGDVFWPRTGLRVRPTTFYVAK